MSCGMRRLLHGVQTIAFCRWFRCKAPVRYIDAVAASALFYARPRIIDASAHSGVRRPSRGVRGVELSVCGSDGGGRELGRYYRVCV